MRAVSRIYSDPLDLIWRHAAEQMGMTIERSDEVYASWDGAGTLHIGTPPTLDADDTLAQMILHECCHALCQWPDGLTQADWGLQIDNPDHRVFEHACLRLQAALTEPHGLRQFLAATTTFRRYYDRLPADPLADDSDPAVPVARSGMQQATTGPWAAALQTALQLTAWLHRVVRDVAPQDSLWRADDAC